MRPLQGKRMIREIAIFDYKILPTNPIGSCHLRMLRSLCNEYKFTIFAVQFENPCPQRIRFVRIPAPARPLALLFLAYHVLAPIYYWAHRLRHWVQFDVVQMVESNLLFGDISYAQFCHRAYLKYHWKETRPEGLRGVLRWLDHWLHALVEPWVYWRVPQVVVPSQGLARELINEYPWTRDKIHIVPNPVDFQRMRSPEEFDRDAFRQAMALKPEDVVLVFVALGHFERKGLPALLDALTQLRTPQLTLVVVGGEPDLVATYRARIERMGLSAQVIFTGMQRDVRPYLWGADALAFPSLYEIFPLVSLEAAAAGLPLLITRLYGVEEFIRDGAHGILVERTPEGVARGIARFMGLAPEIRRAMGKQVQQHVERYAVEHFVEAWRTFYAEWQMG
jgi:glycosyltransferase involved in cell wall biosynthesis